jgi:hypothetical protein
MTIPTFLFPKKYLAVLCLAASLPLFSSCLIDLDAESDYDKPQDGQIAPVLWYISGSDEAGTRPAGESRSLGGALNQIKHAYGNGDFRNGDKAVITVSGTLTPYTEKRSGNRFNMVTVSGPGYPPLVLRGGKRPGFLDADGEMRVLLVKDAFVTLADGITLCNGNTGSQQYGGGVLVDGGKLRMTGGSIQNCKAILGGGVMLYEHSGAVRSFFEMSGGSLSGCALMNRIGEENDGAGVYVDSHCGFTLSGSGRIENNGNSDTAAGGGVFVNGHGQFTMKGGSITGNTAVKRGGGLRVAPYGEFTLLGGSITGNTAPKDRDISVN